MLKKAGIVVAVAAAGVLAVSPLAFATSPGEHRPGDGHDHRNGSDRSQVDVDYTSIQRDNLTNDCQFGQAGPDVDSTVAGGSSLLGILNPVIGLVAPITAQVNALNCTNIGISDVIDFGSNNDTTTSERTEVEGSFNTDIDD